ncbi:uncharacterized protein VTP21DRAFT_6187 [Calcarisporiella thermophila]|uniref:uncharacterized protein n=1 Tax=Calcarisporiella thermophila TaxID=911321 RepID=UPI003743A61E
MSSDSDCEATGLGKRKHVAAEFDENDIAELDDLLAKAFYSGGCFEPFMGIKHNWRSENNCKMIPKSLSSISYSQEDPKEKLGHEIALALPVETR